MCRVPSGSGFAPVTSCASARDRRRRECSGGAPGRTRGDVRGTAEVLGTAVLAHVAGPGAHATDPAAAAPAVAGGGAADRPAGAAVAAALHPGGALQSCPVP